MRALVAALLAANLAFWAWTQGWLDFVVTSRGDREPERLARQVQPERVRIVGAARPASAVGAGAAHAGPGAAHSGPGAGGAGDGCYEAGPFTPIEVVAAEAALVRAALPPGSWSNLRVDRAGSFIVYIGRFATRDQLAQREDELRRQQLSFEPVRNSPDLEFGLSLGRFDERGQAEQALASLQQRGLRGARVLTVAAPSTSHLLRVERADAALQSQLAALRAPALGAGFVRCGQSAR